MAATPLDFQSLPGNWQLFIIELSARGKPDKDSCQFGEGEYGAFGSTRHTACHRPTGDPQVLSEGTSLSPALMVVRAENCL